MICRFDPPIFVFFEKIYLSAFDKRLFLFLRDIFMIHPTYLSASWKYIFGNVIGPTDFSPDTTYQGKQTEAKKLMINSVNK